MKKVLLLTDMPPCKHYTGGLVLDQLCRFLPKGSVACFAIVCTQYTNARLSPDLADSIPIEYYDKPNENWNVYSAGKNIFTGGKSVINKLTSFVNESYHAAVTNRMLTKKVVEFGRKAGAELIWCVMQGQTEIRLILPVAEELGIPYVIQVWDPYYLWLDAHAVDGITKSILLKKIVNNLKKSAGVGAASWAMAEQYSRDYGVRAIPLPMCLDSSLAAAPAKKIGCADEIVIGACGKFYPEEVWKSLFDALDTVDWKIGGKNIKIRLFTDAAKLSATGRMNVEFMGWRPQKEVIGLLSAADILYCPYWFDPYFEMVVRQSFPGKLTTLLAAGRPVFFHGPEFASPARFLTQNDAGVVCDSVNGKVIIETLSRLISDPGLYARLSENGRKAFDKFLTLDSMRKNFVELLQVD